MQSNLNKKFWQTVQSEYSDKIINKYASTFICVNSIHFENEWQKPQSRCVIINSAKEFFQKKEFLCFEICDQNSVLFSFKSDVNPFDTNLAKARIEIRKEFLQYMVDNSAD
jgi:hypothetical protein